MMGLLGSGLVGGVAGAAAADTANIAEQNKQIEGMNLESQKAAVENMYQTEREKRGYALAGRYRDEVIKPVMQNDVPALMAPDKLLPMGQKATQEQIDAGMKNATPEQEAAYQAVALNRAGIGSDVAQKEGLGIINRGSENEALKIAWLGRGVEPAKIAADAKNHTTDVEAQTKLSIADLQQASALARTGAMDAGTARRLLESFNFDSFPIDVKNAVKAAAKGPAAKGLLGGGAPSDNLPASQFDATFPPVQNN